MVNANLSEYEREHDVNHQYTTTKKRKKDKTNQKLGIKELTDN